MESLLPLRLDVVTVLLLAVKAVNVLTSHRNIALSNPALATLKENFTFNILNELQLSKKNLRISYNFSNVLTCSRSFAYARAFT